MFPTPQGMCQHCNLRPAADVFAESTSAMVHGSYEFWCEICVLETQIGHAKERAAAIPAMETRLAVLLEDWAAHNQGRYV